MKTNKQQQQWQQKHLSEWGSTVCQALDQAPEVKSHSAGEASLGHQMSQTETQAASAVFRHIVQSMVVDREKRKKNLKI